MCFIGVMLLYTSCKTGKLAYLEGGSHYLNERIEKDQIIYAVTYERYGAGRYYCGYSVIITLGNDDSQKVKVFLLANGRRYSYSLKTNFTQSQSQMYQLACDYVYSPDKESVVVIGHDSYSYHTYHHSSFTHSTQSYTEQVLLNGNGETLKFLFRQFEEIVITPQGSLACLMGNN